MKNLNRNLCTEEAKMVEGWMTLHSGFFSYREGVEKNQM